MPQCTVLSKATQEQGKTQQALILSKPWENDTTDNSDGVYEMQ